MTIVLHQTGEPVVVFVDHIQYIVDVSNKAFSGDFKSKVYLCGDSASLVVDESLEDICRKVTIAKGLP